ncbi:MAG: HAD family phosphatase [Lachnospiraceae bacterium]|nr:HAD family phosphatase [Lachnospiraceae bacterium]
MIRNLVFDIGGVLLGYRWEDILRRSGLSREEGLHVAGLIFADPLWYELDAGNITLADVRRLYPEKYPAYAHPISFILERPDEMPIPREKVWSYLKPLKEKGYGIYVLSNYGAELFTMHTKDAPFWKDVDGSVISYEVHACKPDREIYLALLEKYDLKAGECIFFDDRKSNVDGAVAVGMQGAVIGSEEELTGYLEKYLCD